MSTSATRNVVSICDSFHSLLVRSALACTAYEDTYLTLLDVDGPEYADHVRERMTKGHTATYYHSSASAAVDEKSSLIV